MTCEVCQRPRLAHTPRMWALCERERLRGVASRAADRVIEIIEDVAAMPITDALRAEVRALMAPEETEGVPDGE